MKNDITAVLSDEDKEKIFAAVAEASGLLSFLVTKSKDDQKRSRRMGAKSVDYVGECLRAAQQHSDVIPANVDIAEFARDVAIINQMQPIRGVVVTLLERLDDSIAAAGSDSMSAADIVYAYMKTAARTNAAVKASVDAISKRYKGQGRKSKPVSNA